MTTKPKTRKAKPDAKACSPMPNLAADCPARRLIKRTSELLQIEEAMFDDKDLSSRDEVMYNVFDEIEAIRHYATSLRALSLEGAFFQLALAADKLREFEDVQETNLKVAYRALQRLMFSIAGVLAQHAPSVASEPALAAHLPPYKNPQTWFEEHESARR
ncbi:MAG: hypothetical protein ACT4O2_14215 [Beijerinckiaceae bacterium]